jgi:hypothetical protein
MLDCLKKKAFFKRSVILPYTLLPIISSRETKEN